MHTYGWPRKGWRSGADCPNAILACAFVKPGVVDGHHAPDLWKSAREKPPLMGSNPAALRVDEWKTLKDKQRKEQSVCLCKCKARKNLSWHFLEVSLTFSPPREHYLENCSKVSLVTNDKLLNCKYFSQSRCAVKRSWWIINIITDLKSTGTKQRQQVESSQRNSKEKELHLQLIWPFTKRK